MDQAEQGEEAAQATREGGCCAFASRHLRRLSLSQEQRQVVNAGVVAGVGVSLGVTMAFPNLALDAWTVGEDVTLSPHQVAWFGSVLYVAAVPASLVGGTFLQLLGPRRMLLLLLPVLTLVWLLPLLTIQHPTLLIALRAAQGVLVSCCGLCSYVYPCEVVEASRRGTVGSLTEAAFSLGFLLAHLLAACFHWTTVMLLVPPCIFLPTVLAVASVVESPTWLLHADRLEEARAVLERIRPAGFNVEKEMLAMQLSGPDHREGSNPLVTLSRPRFMVPLLASLILMTLKECTGQVVVVLTAVRIFRAMGQGWSPLWSSVLMCSARFVANIAGSSYVDSRPRRQLLSLSALVTGVSMMFLAIYFTILDSGILWPYWVPLISILVFVVAYGGGVGLVSSLLAIELLPGAVRGVGAGIITSIMCAVQFGLIHAAVKADATFTTHFSYYAVGSFLLAGFAWLLPETRKVKLTEIEEYWREAARTKILPKWLRHNQNTAAVKEAPESVVADHELHKNSVEFCV